MTPLPEHTPANCRVAIIGYSNIAFRIAERLVEAGAAVLFAINEADRENACSTLAGIELLVLHTLRPAALPAEIGACVAAVVASDDEQFNLHVTMHLSFDLPDLQIVTRLFNLDLGREIEQRMPRVKVLSVSEHAAPFFAAAAFRDEVQKAWRQADQLMVRCKGEEQGAPIRDDTAPTDRGCGPGVSCLPRKIRPDLMLAGVLSGIALVIAVSTIFFWFGMGMSPGDALYFVVTTLTTTGYGDYSLKEYPFYAKLAGMSLMLSGAGLFAILFALLTDKMFRMRLDLVMGRRHVRADGHVIVCGAGDVGIRVVECLRLTGTKTVVVERNEKGRFNQRVREFGIPLIIDDATLIETLDRAAVQSALAIICATDSDMLNLEIALSARSRNSGIRTVVRVYERDFAEQMQRSFRVEAALSSSAIAARYFAEAALDN